MRLSLAMIVKDEAAHLDRCLASVRGLVDQMVVLDTGSSDGTPELARSHGAEVHAFPWTGDFAEARNAGLARCDGDWVLVLDADEAIEAADHPMIRSALAEPPAARRLIIRNYYRTGTVIGMDQQAKPNPGGCAAAQDLPFCSDGWHTRLFRNRPGVAFSGRIHELVDPFFEAAGEAPVDLPAVIHHFGQALLDRVQLKKSLYLEMARRDVQERPEDLQSHFNLVIQAGVANAWAETLEASDRLLAKAPGWGGAVPTPVYLHRARALLALSRPAEALAAFDRFLRDAPGNLAGLIGRGMALALTGRQAEALTLLGRCAAEHPEAPSTHLAVADLEAGLGRPEAARAALRRGLEALPGDPGLHERLVRLGLDGGDVAQAVQDAWAALQVLPKGGGGAWHRLVAVFLLRQGARDQGRAVLDLGLAAFPDDPDLRRLKESL